MNIKPSENEKIIYLEKLLNRFEFNNDLKNGVMFFLGGSILIPTKETQIEQLQIASQLISKFDLNKEYEEILGPLRDIYIQSFFEEYIWRLGIDIEPRKIRVPDTNIEVSEFEFKNHKRLDKKDTKIKNFFEKELFLERMLEGVGKELSSQGYQLKKSFEAGNCFFNLKAQVDTNCTTELLYIINNNLTPILDWILMIGRSATLIPSDEYLDIQIALTSLIHGQDEKFIELLWSFQSFVLYFQQKEIAGISDLSVDDFKTHCRQKVIYFLNSVDKKHILNVANQRIHNADFPPLMSNLDEQKLFNNAFQDTFGKPNKQGHRSDIHLKCLIIYSYFNVICETILSNNSEINLQ